MQNKDVLAVLDYLNIEYDDPNGKNDYESTYSFNHNVQYEKILGKLMNITLQCLGAIRVLAIEEEKVRISEDCADVSGTKRSSGNAALVQRQVFCQAVHSMTDTILPARELNQHDPIKELIESFPWSPSLQESNWFMLNWAMMTPFMESPIFAATTLSTNQLSMVTTGMDELHLTNTETNLNSIEQENMQLTTIMNTQKLNNNNNNNTTPKDHHYLVKQVLSYYPNSISEIDKFGQTYLSYVVRCQSLPILQDVLLYHKHCTRIKDAAGRTLFHYLVYYSNSIEGLLLVCEHIGITLKGLFSSHTNTNTNTMVTPDDYGNTLIHTACLGICDVSVLQELLFLSPESIKQLNNDGQLPLHCLCLNHTMPTTNELAKARLLLAAYPSGMIIRDSKGWLPIQYAVSIQKNVELIKGLLSYNIDMVKTPLTSGRILLHYACVKCYSSKLIQYLLHLYPESAKCMDENQRLPLHTLIARCEYLNPSRIRCLRLLLDAFPEGASFRDKDGNTPYDLAVRDGQGELVIRLLLRAEPGQNPEHLGELSYLASQSKYKQYLQKKDKRQQQHQQQRRNKHKVDKHRPVDRYAPSQYPRDNNNNKDDQSSYATGNSSSRYTYRSNSRHPSRGGDRNRRRHVEEDQQSYHSRSRRRRSDNSGESSYRNHQSYDSYDSYDDGDSYYQKSDDNGEEEEGEDNQTYDTSTYADGRSATSATSDGGGSYSYYTASTIDQQSLPAIKQRQQQQEEEIEGKRKNNNNNQHHRQQNSDNNSNQEGEIDVDGSEYI